MVSNCIIGSQRSSSATNAGLVGGGRWPRPGEISLSHRGVLFLDELPEFGHADLEVLRRPLEDKVVTISRAQGSVTFPANFMLVAAMNPCPCGYYGDPVKQCTCSPMMVARYQKRVSGPLIDRTDIFAEVPHVGYEKLADDRLGETSETVRQRPHFGTSRARRQSLALRLRSLEALTRGKAPYERRAHGPHRAGRYECLFVYLPAPEAPRGTVRDPLPS